MAGPIREAVKQVVANRPEPIRRFDQIYMRSEHMVRQIMYVAPWLSNRRVVFIGDGDGIGLCLTLLRESEVIRCGPSSVVVLDFDERIVRSITTFAQSRGLSTIMAHLYNVCDPLPREFWRAFSGFYTNPPYGASNGGISVKAFTLRGIEATGADSVGCVVVGDDPQYPWTQGVLLGTQQFLLRSGFVISYLRPRFLQYELDDAPDLRSCSMIVSRVGACGSCYNSKPLSRARRSRFYGMDKPLRVRYLRVCTDIAGGQSTREEPLG